MAMELFRKFDQNRSNKLEPEETIMFQKHLENAFRETDSEDLKPKSIFKTAGMDDDGNIPLKDFVRWFQTYMSYPDHLVDNPNLTNFDFLDNYRKAQNYGTDNFVRENLGRTTFGDEDFSNLRLSMGGMRDSRMKKTTVETTIVDLDNEGETQTYTEEVMGYDGGLSSVNGSVDSIPAVVKKTIIKSQDSPVTEIRTSIYEAGNGQEYIGMSIDGIMGSRRGSCTGMARRSMRVEASGMGLLGLGSTRRGAMSVSVKGKV